MRQSKVNLRKTRFWVFTFLLCYVITVFGQSNAITGKVIDEFGEPVIGASVILKGSTTGVITDFDGLFSLQVPNAKKGTLVISFIGYNSVELALNGKTHFNVTLKESSMQLEEVTVVAYGVQKKETLTGAISSVKTEELIASPNASVANSLAGKVTGLSTVQTSGQPGAEDPKIFVRGVGSLTDGGATPLILVDGVERSFFQMDPNEIENVTVLKDASATAVFGVRGANGVILVTTRRGKEGEAKISVNSSVGFQMPTRTLDMADSYTYATIYNEQERNDGRKPVFSDYVIERFRTGDEPLMFPSIKWREYLTKNAAIQTQHNVNVSGGTKNVRYFISAGFLHQDGLFKDFGRDDLGYNYNRYNYRTNLDLSVTRSTTLKIGIGGVVGDKKEPTRSDLWLQINQSQPFSSPGIVDGVLMVSQGSRYENIKMVNPLEMYLLGGNKRELTNTMNMDIHLVQKLDFVTKGLSVEVKGAYNTNYKYTKTRQSPCEVYTPYYVSEVDGSGMTLDDIYNPDFNNDIVYRISGQKSKASIGYEYGRGRNWYFEASVRYNRKFGNHNVTGLILYNQNKTYYPKEMPYIPTAYVGLVGRATYDYKSRYMAEFNIGYNGSENFAPDKRYGTFPALSLGYIISEESFMKNQKIFDFLKLRASIGLVGNDNMNNYRYLYLPDSYDVNMIAKDNDWRNQKWGYNFGLNNKTQIPGSVEQRLANPGVTWETALKQNYGIDMNFLDNRLKVKVEYFLEDRKNILINRTTIPALTALTKEIMPVVNMGRVKNKGYEIDMTWNDKIGEDFNYNVNANMSYSKNKIIFMDEVEPNEPYMRLTGESVGIVQGYVADGFYSEEDFVDTENWVLKEGLPIPQVPVRPGDVKYLDLNDDDKITPDDIKRIGFSNRPNYVFGLNLGANYKGFFFSMNWAGAAERSVVLSENFRKPFSAEGRALMQFHVDNRWTPETAETATQPRLSLNSQAHNYMNSTLWVKDGSYLKLKNLTVGYNFNNNPLLKKIGIKQLGVKFTAYNLLTFDHLKIMDPESNPSYYGDTYPVVKIYNLGLNLTF